MKKDKKAILITAVLLAVLCLLAALGYQRFAPKGVAGEKESTVKVIHGDSGEKEFTYTTDEKFLGAVLEAEGLAEGEEGPYGLFITTVDGEKAEESRQQWWCLTKGGETVNTSATQTPIEDGDVFELTLTEGY